MARPGTRGVRDLHARCSRARGAESFTLPLEHRRWPTPEDGSEHAHAHGHVPGAHHSVSAHGYGLNVRSGPSTEHRIVHVLDEGERIHVRGCDAHNWCEVTYSGHHHGWVFAHYLD